ncbi:hypothetical protein QMP26_05225 [Enterocloster clostridioformis]|uniref:hypothetical protein n=1 Tax=Enterocloster clostridioformis TaxID=1531 RepID=UPI0026767A53|nr:hypothetical protein [Enterocloster clostridioformis]
MDQESKAVRLLMLIGVSGEMPADWAAYAVGSCSYSAALITRLKREGYISLRFKDGLKGYVLKAKAKKKLLELWPGNFAPFLCGSVETNHIKSEPDKRLRLYRMSMVWIYLSVAGVPVYKSSKPDFFSPMFHPVPSGEGQNTIWMNMGGYYGTLEFKSGMAKEIGGSRACGVLLTSMKPYIVYNSMDSLMKWAKKTERTMRSRLEAVFWNKGYRFPTDAVMFGNGMDMLVRILESDGGIKGNLFALDDIYDRIYFIPLIQEAQIQVRLLVKPEEDRRLRGFLCTALWEINEADGALYDGVDCDGNPVYVCYDLELWSLKRVRGKIEREGRGTIYCFDYQEEVLRAYIGGEAVVKGIVREKAIRFLEEG